MLLPGQAKKIGWNLPDPSISGEYKDFCKTRDKIKQLVEDFFKRGYLKAFVNDNNIANIVLNNLSEGIIAHDIDRNIVFFNNAAEKITGYSKKEIVGNDCHNVFPGKFCGNKCSFCGKCPLFDSAQYPVDITTKSGDIRNVEMMVKSVKDNNGNMTGVVASFRDVTIERSMAHRLGKIESFAGIIGNDKKMLEIFDLIRSVADVKIPVFIEGESGTGKELVAVAIHNEGSRAEKLFVPVNCGALPENLLESELFGHVKGAFTGAVRDKKGRFELADGGTIFLDEIGDISLAMQVKLLRVLQEGTFEKVGDTKTIKTNVRVISATNKDIRTEIKEGRFREDLYYRLCVMPIKLPPLRERAGDIPLIVDNLIKRISEDTGNEILISPSTVDILMSYEWRGNIRELQNALQFAAVKCRNGLIKPHHLPPHIANMPSLAINSDNFASSLINTRKNKLTTKAVDTALKQTGGNKAKAARVLGVGRATLYRFIDNK